MPPGEVGAKGIVTKRMGHKCIICHCFICQMRKWKEDFGRGVSIDGNSV